MRKSANKRFVVIHRSQKISQEEEEKTLLQWFYSLLWVKALLHTQHAMIQAITNEKQFNLDWLQWHIQPDKSLNSLQKHDFYSFASTMRLCYVHKCCKCVCVRSNKKWNHINQLMSDAAWPNQYYVFSQDC